MSRAPLSRDDDGGPAMSARFHSCPEDPAPQGDRMIAAALVWVALVIVVLALGWSLT